MPALFAGVLTLLVCVSASAQPPNEEPAERVEGHDEEATTATEPNGPIHVDPVTGRRYRHARPEEPLRQGAIQVERWVPVAVGVGAAVAAGALLVLAHRRRRRKP